MTELPPVHGPDCTRRPTCDPATSTDRPVDVALAAVGVQLSFCDDHGITRHVTDATAALLAARLTGSGTHSRGPLVTRPGFRHDGLHGTLHAGDGVTFAVDGDIPADCPVGYYQLVQGELPPRMVAVTPTGLVTPRRQWGLATQLYATRSNRSWGIGDFDDLAVLARTAATNGAGMLLVSPLHATRPGRQQASPYSPASRLFLNVGHIAAMTAPGAASVDLSDLDTAGRALNDCPLIDRDRIWPLKIAALERIYAAGGWDSGPFDVFRTERGDHLDRFATWSALAEIHPGPWWQWPVGYRRADTAAVAEFAASHSERIRFWAWCQWVADVQFAASCNQGVDVMVDLAVGFDAGGADAWAWQDMLCLDFEVGCPSDQGNPGGQRWGLPPFDPTALAAANYEPFIAMIRAGMRHAGALRIDHVMGLWRLYWVPCGSADATDGAYVRSAGDDLVGLIALEAAATGRPVWVVGEDMGTVEDSVRASMSAAGMLSYRVAGRCAPHEFPEMCMGAIATHDQATIAGVVTGSDLDDCRRIGKPCDPAGAAASRRHLLRTAGIDIESPASPDVVDATIRGMYRVLGASPSLIAVATLDDIAGVAVRPNMPGTIDAWPNWCIPLPAPFAELLDRPLACDVMDALDHGRGDRRTAPARAPGPVRSAV